MNIISNTCLGAATQKDCLHQLYENPFCWNVIDFDSMYYLIDNYENINYDDFQIIKNAKWEFSIKIDGRVIVNFPHYRFDRNASKLTIKGVDVYWDRIWEFIVEKYEERLSRMKSKPIFFIGSIHHHHNYSKNQIISICDLCRKKGYKLIIANENFDLSKEYPEFRFIKTEHTEEDFGNGGFALEIYPQIESYLRSE